MKVFIDRASIEPRDLTIYTEGLDEIIIEDREQKVYAGDPVHLATAIVEGLAAMRGQDFMWSGSCIPMIKDVRRLTGWGLRESKDFVEALRDFVNPEWRMRGQ